MGRQVIRPREALRGAEGSDSGDTYLKRLFKLIPSETVAVYLFVQGVLRSSLDDPGESVQLQTWLWGVYAVLIVGNLLAPRRPRPLATRGPNPRLYRLGLHHRRALRIPPLLSGVHGVRHSRTLHVLRPRHLPGTTRLVRAYCGRRTLFSRPVAEWIVRTSGLRLSAQSTGTQP